MIKTTIAMMMLTTPAFADFTKFPAFQRGLDCVSLVYLDTLTKQLNVTPEEFLTLMPPKAISSMDDHVLVLTKIIWRERLGGSDRTDIVNAIEAYPSKVAVYECWGAI